MSDSTMASALYAEAITARTLRAVKSGALASVEDVVAHVRKATLPRVGFSAVMAALSTTVLPVTYAAIWFAFIALWEFVLRIWLEDKFALPGAAHAQNAGFRWLAGIHFLGASAYAFYPMLVWSSGAAVGMVLATAWICSAANHLFVYFSANRPLLLSCLLPLAGCALAAPFLADGWSLAAVVAATTLVCLILAAGMIGVDRNILLANLARHAAARATAEQESAAKSQFLATMSHELRTPLNAIIGYAELIEEEAGGQRIGDDAAKISGSAHQLRGVIDVILDLSRLESGGVAMERERMPVALVLEQVRAAAAPLAAVNRNTIVITERGALGDADIDHRRLHQCLLQLISNAAKFTSDGEIRVTASRRVENNRPQLVFEIADTGIGIPPTQQARIFEPFVQAETGAERRFEGAGLGLSLVRRLSRLMGGDVACLSAPGRGSTFTLWVDAEGGG